MSGYAMTITCECGLQFHYAGPWPFTTRVATDAARWRERHQCATRDDA